VSKIKRNRVVIIERGIEVNLVRGFEIETFSGSMVEAPCNVIEVSLRVCGEISSFWQELSEEAVRVFIGAALPRGMRVGEKDAQSHLGHGQKIARSTGLPRPQTALGD
jgi:hypothetical protein